MLRSTAVLVFALVTHLGANQALGETVPAAAPNKASPSSVAPLAQKPAPLRCRFIEKVSPTAGQAPKRIAPKKVVAAFAAFLARQLENHPDKKTRAAVRELRATLKKIFTSQSWARELCAWRSTALDALGRGFHAIDRLVAANTNGACLCGAPKGRPTEGNVGTGN